jgi:hypothetical protein
LPKAVAAAAQVAPVRQEQAPQGLVAAREEPARRPEVVGPPSVAGRRQEQLVEARQRERSVVEHPLPAPQIILRQPYHRRRRLKNKRRLLHLPTTRRPLAES